VLFIKIKDIAIINKFGLLVIEASIPQIKKKNKLEIINFLDPNLSFNNPTGILKII
jgi:hypothetical protein